MSALLSAPLSADSLAAGAVRLLDLALREAILAAALFAVVLLLCRLLRRATPRLHHGLWALVLLRLVLPPDLASPVSLGALAGGWAPEAILAVDSAAAPAAAAAPTARAAPAGPDAAPLVPAAPPTAPRGSATAATGAGTGELYALPILALWALGSAFVLALLVVRRRRYRRALRTAEPIADGPLAAAAERWRRRLGVRRRVELRLGDRLLSPFTAGLLCPVVYLPRALVERGGEETVEAVLAHEMAHVARCDAAWLALQNAVQVLWFFNPLARAVAARCHDARERAADELVLAGGAMTPRRYAAGLVEALSLGLVAADGPQPVSRLGSPKRRWTMRIEQILRRRAGGSPSPWPALVCALAAVLLLPMAVPAGEPPPEADIVPVLGASPEPLPAPAPLAPPVLGITPPPAPEPPSPAPRVEPTPVIAPAPVPVPEPTPAVPQIAPAPVPVPAPAPAPAPPVPAVAPTPASAPTPSTAPAAEAEPTPARPSVLVHPLPGAEVTSDFGWRRDPQSGERKLHNGIDLGAPEGTPVRATAAGRVVLVGERQGPGGSMGTVVVLDHGDGYGSRYHHLGSVAVERGDRVEAGEVIAEVGMTGFSTGPHLHLELSSEGSPVDPRHLMDF